MKSRRPMIFVSPVRPVEAVFFSVRRRACWRIIIKRPCLFVSPRTRDAVFFRPRYSILIPRVAEVNFTSWGGDSVNEMNKQRDQTNKELKKNQKQARVGHMTYRLSSRPAVLAQPRWRTRANWGRVWRGVGGVGVREQRVGTHPLWKGLSDWLAAWHHLVL